MLYTDHNKQEVIEDILLNIEQVLIGRRKEVINILKGILAGGHVLIEDVPGVGKTTLIKVLSKTLNLSYNRIQFTPDLLPTDIIGVSIFNQKKFEFEFKKGPVFCNILLADEINRASPKTQSALLQAMEEKYISEGNVTYRLDDPFIVLATQNPIEYEGTFSLPEAQLDRFMIKTSIGYPSFDDEMKILKVYKNNNPMKNIKHLINKEVILSLRNKVREIKIHEDLFNYIVTLVRETRNNEYISLGGSIRASMNLLRVSQATAFINGRDYVIPDDIRENLKIVLCHRIVLSPLARREMLSEAEVIEYILNKVPVSRVI